MHISVAFSGRATLIRRHRQLAACLSADDIVFEAGPVFLSEENTLFGLVGEFTEEPAETNRLRAADVIEVIEGFLFVGSAWTWGY